MKRIGILGDIGAGKSFVAKQFRSPVFDADKEVRRIYKYDKYIFICTLKLRPQIPIFWAHMLPKLAPEILEFLAC